LDLKASGVGKNGVGPIHKFVDAAETFDIMGTRAKVEVIVVGEDDLGSDLF